MEYAAGGDLEALFEYAHATYRRPRICERGVFNQLIAYLCLECELNQTKS
jgi:hypothetical protein